MSPRQVTAASGCKRWACTKCGLSSINRWDATVCCNIYKEKTVSDLPCDTEPYAPQPGEFLEINPVGPATPEEAVEEPAIPTPKAAELLGRAARHMHDRATTYDKPEGERSMGRCVEAFNAITGHALSESEGWLLLAVLKQVRLFTRKDYHADSAEDGIAYLALMAEAREAGR